MRDWNDLLGETFSAKPKGASKRMGYQNGKFLISENWAFWYPFILVPVWVSLLQHPKGYQNDGSIKMASFFEF